jgi:glycerol uptake facilitator-like aquaporin
MAKSIKSSKTTKDLPQAIIAQMLSLATSGFGLVAALAWNEVVKEAVNSWVKPYLPAGSGLVSLLLYAVIVTALAVFITLQLTKLDSTLTSLTAKKKR